MRYRRNYCALRRRTSEVRFDELRKSRENGAVGAQAVVISLQMKENNAHMDPLIVLQFTSSGGGEDLVGRSDTVVVRVFLDKELIKRELCLRQG